MEKGISPTAILERIVWEKIATRWEFYVHPDTYLRCRECHQGIARISDRHGIIYAYSLPELLALKVAHIRQVHSEIREVFNEHD